jgi:transcriptional regulator with XRE-family HTH domain
VKSKKVEITEDKLIEEDLTKEELSNSIGKIIRELRLSKKMSLECLSNETGIGYSQLSRIERGKINTSIYQIYLIIKTLNVPINTLLEVLITDVIRSYKQKNKKYIKNKINKSIMKKITLFLLSCVLLATACNQNNTTPTTPPATGYSIDSSYYFKINFNGQTLHYYTAIMTENGVSANLAYPISITPSSFCDFQMENVAQANFAIYHADVTFNMYFNKLNTTGWIGTYKGNNYLGGQNAGTITDLTTSTAYTVDTNSTATIVSMNALSVTGTFTCTLQNGSVTYPATGSFCLKKII